MKLVYFLFSRLVVESFSRLTASPNHRITIMKESPQCTQAILRGRFCSRTR